jgi:hypothetical protein
MEKPTPEAVRIGRLEKKIRKLKQQLAATKERNAFFNEVLKYYPYSMTTHEEKMRQQSDREELKALRVRVKEQSALIKKLTDENENKNEKKYHTGDPFVLAMAEAIRSNSFVAKGQECYDYIFKVNDPTIDDIRAMAEKHYDGGKKLAEEDPSLEPMVKEWKVKKKGNV